MPDMIPITAQELMILLRVYAEKDTLVYVDKGSYKDHPITGIVQIPNGVRLLTTPGGGIVDE